MRRSVPMWLALLLTLFGVVIGVLVGVKVPSPLAAQSGGTSVSQSPSAKPPTWPDMLIPEDHEYQTGLEVALKDAGYTGTGLMRTYNYLGEEETRRCYSQTWYGSDSTVLLSMCGEGQYVLRQVDYNHPLTSEGWPMVACEPRGAVSPSVTLADCGELNRAYGEGRLHLEEEVGKLKSYLAVHPSGTVTFYVNF